MKKVLLIALAALFSMTAFAISPEEMAASQDRIAALKKMSTPDKVGLSEIDAYATTAIKARQNVLDIAPILHEYWRFATGQQNELTVYLSDLQKIYKDLEEQTKLIGDATVQGGKATGDIGKAKGPAKLKATKSVNASTDMVKAATEETTFQGKVLSWLMERITE